MSMATHTIDQVRQPAEAGLHHALALNAAGSIQVLRVTRKVQGSNEHLMFAGVPTSPSSKTRGLEVTFVTGVAPAPKLDPVSGVISMYYSISERAEVERLLNSDRKRFCYFWRSADGERRHAWLLTSP